MFVSVTGSFFPYQRKDIFIVSLLVFVDARVACRCCVVTAGATHGRMVGLRDRRPSSVLTRASPDSVVVADPSCGAAQPTRCRRVRTPQAPVNARPSLRR